MSRKNLFLVWAVLALAALALSPTAEACQGYVCGCDTAEQICINDCPAQGQPGHDDCVRACAIEAIRCAKCCCCEIDGEDWCNPNWGCGGSGVVTLSAETLESLLAEPVQTSPPPAASPEASPFAHCDLPAVATEPEAALAGDADAADAVGRR